jgi:formate dehydrogenase iron-sulfur subunit
VGRQHAHLPLVFMLVLTQMSVGAVVVDQLLAFFPAPGQADSIAGARAVQSVAAFFLGMLGLGAAIFHLGRPQYAFRAIIGLRTSWLSREILAFGVFAFMATLYAALPWLPLLGSSSFEEIRRAVGALAAASGMAGVFCSVMIYASTRRPFWNMPRTGLKFLLTSAILGLPTALLIWLIAAAWFDGLTVNSLMAHYGAVLCAVLAILTTVKLLLEAAIFLSLARKQFTPLKRTALLMAGELGPLTLQRFAMGLAGGFVLPAVLAAPYFLKPASGHSPLFVACAVGFSVILLVVGELLERYSFFTAVVAPKMPGAPAS